MANTLPHALAFVNRGDVARFARFGPPEPPARSAWQSHAALARLGRRLWSPRTPRSLRVAKPRCARPPWAAALVLVRSIGPDGLECRVHAGRYRQAIRRGP